MMTMEKTDIALLFDKEMPKGIECINTSHGEKDFRETLLVEYEHGRFVIKLADNGFTDEARVDMWKTAVDRYRELGYYCPRLYRAADGTYPHVAYKGHTCIAWGEEYSAYRTAYDIMQADQTKKQDDKGNFPYLKELLLMNAKVAAAHYDYTTLPSGYCMFAVFDPYDAVDEVEEDALRWKEEADTLPDNYHAQVERIWNRWLTARHELKQIYGKLPTSVFQADCNDTNVLLDERGRFVGVMDFNLAGREVYVTLLVREVPYISGRGGDRFEQKDYYLNSIKNALKISAEAYTFDEWEKKALPLLYKCIRPLYWHSTDLLKRARQNDTVRACLDEIEYEQTRDIDFWE